MIHFEDNDTAIRAALHFNPEYIDFVRDDCTKEYIAIPVENFHVILFHNIDDTFSSYLLPQEVYNPHSNIRNMCRIAIIIEKIANEDYRNQANTNHKD